MSFSKTLSNLHYPPLNPSPALSLVWECASSMASYLACITISSPELKCSTLSDLFQHTSNQNLIQSDTPGMSAHSPLTLHSAQTHTASLVGAVCQPLCERLISRLQKTSSVLTKRGRAMERALRPGERLSMCVCSCVSILLRLGQRDKY